jgi:CRP-like cAMP-binding protein
VVQVPGAAWRVDTETFQAEVRRCKALSAALHDYLYAFLVHLSQSAACNSYHSVEKRCCRWLILARDRVGRDEFPLTHEFLGQMLGVRRTGVTEVARALQRAGLIRYRRGQMTILDPAGLEAASCPCYRVVRTGYGGMQAEA